MAVAGLLFALYLTTLAPGVVSISDDTLEFQMVALLGAIPHPTGYPLLGMLLPLFARLVPLGEVAFRANLLAALFAAGAGALTYLVGRRLGQSRSGALFGAGLLGVAPEFWRQGTVIEVYGLHLLITGLALHALLAWGARPADERRRLPAGAAFWFGMGLAHHQTIVLWVPAALLYLLLRLRPWRDGWRVQGIGRSLAAGAAPLLLYLWLPLRAEVGSIDGTFRTVGTACWIRACQYTSSFLGRESAIASRVGADFYLALTRANLGVPALLLAVTGALHLRRRSAAWWLLAAGGLTNLLFAVNYIVPDREVFWLPLLWLLALLAGSGLDGLRAQIDRWFPSRLGRLLGALVVGLAFLLVAGRGLQSRPQVDLSGVTGPPDFAGRDILAQPLPPRATIVALLGEATYLSYLHRVDHVAGSVEIVATQTDPQALRFEAVERALQQGRRPFLTRPLEGAGERWSLAALGPLIAVQRDPTTALPGDMRALELPVLPGILLAGWQAHEAVGASPARLTLAWRTTGPLDASYKVSARTLDAGGEVVRSIDRFPVLDAYPTDQWRVGEIILDSYEISTPPAGGSYLVILYDPESGAEAGRAAWTP